MALLLRFRPVAVLEASLLIEDVKVTQHVRNEDKQDHDFGFSGSVEEVATLAAAAGRFGVLVAVLCSLLSSLHDVTCMVVQLVMFYVM